ncbi:M61 glycyl aminopeptidase [Pirellula sp. SH-Sr6A]|nr:M61 glycyl aminopeptidase [Pirellula sp. SH-Sr6A]
MLGPRIANFLPLTLLFLLTHSSVAETMPEKNLAPVQYRVSFRQAENHRCDVEVTVPAEGADSIELMMPVWTPGSYLVREYARQIETIQARDGVTNHPLVMEKSTKNRWVVTTKGVSEVAVRYSLYCRELGVRTNWIERDFAFLTGAATFLTPVDRLDRKHLVRIESLPHWPNVATSLAKVDEDVWTRVAESFDELVDSPILIGDIDIQSFEAGGAKHHLATIGTDGLWNTAKAAEDVKKIVETEQAFWGVVPYREYWFLNLATESGGGLEHDNSTVLMTSRWAMKQKAKYTDWLGLVSHEFFHTWNVRRLRPKVLMKYDFEGEQYTRELWVAEGVTSYYDDLLLARSGLCSPKDYLERISKGISGVQSAPGRLIQPLSESSFDTWIKFYRPDENAINSRVSYYTKGSIVAMLLDAEIRSATQNQKSLDDVMRMLWKEHLQSGYTTADVLRAANATSGKDLSEWFHRSIETTEEPDFTTFLSWYGLEWKAKESAEAKDKPLPPFHGMDVSNQQGKAIVDKVAKDSPAAQAGINVGDELLAIDGYRVGAENLTERVSLYEAGTIVECTMARRGKLLPIKLKLGVQPAQSWTLQRVAKPTDEQESHWKDWLRIREPVQVVAPDKQP